MPPTPVGTTWITYIRLHDDIGWAVTNENAAAVGEDGFLHRRFLNEYYAGQFPGSFSRGEIFQFNSATGDGRMSGMAASLAGLEKALEENNPAEIELAVRRILLLYSVIFSYGGIPLIYMGDELGLLNDYTYRQNPHKNKDNRWLHRPAMPWEVAAQRNDPTTLTGRLFSEMRNLIEARCRTLQLHSAGSVTPLWTNNGHVFAYLRQHPAHGRLLALCNFSEHPQSVEAKYLTEQGFSGSLLDVSQPNCPPVLVEQGSLLLQPYQFVWLIL
jgi:amylosucrase